MDVSQELKSLIKESKMKNVESMTSFLKDQITTETTEVERLFITNSINKINKNDEEYNTYLNEEGTFYFYERIE